MSHLGRRFLLVVLLSIFAGTSFAFTLTPQVTRNSDGSVNASVLMANPGTTANQVYILASVNGAWFSYSQSKGWAPWTSGNLTDISGYYPVGPMLLNNVNIPIFDHMNLSGLPGIQIFAGMGTTISDVVGNSRVGLVVDGNNLPAITSPCSSSTCLSFSAQVAFSESSLSGGTKALDTVTISGTLTNSTTLVASDTSGCQYTGTMKPASVGVPSMFSGSVTASGCSNPIRNTTYSTFVLTTISTPTGILAVGGSFYNGLIQGSTVK